MVTKRRTALATRKAAGYTQESLAAVLHVERSTVIRWEAGRHAPVPYLWPKLARVLGISRDQLTALLADDDRTHPAARSPSKSQAVADRPGWEVRTSDPGDIDHLLQVLDVDRIIRRV